MMPFRTLWCAAALGAGLACSGAEPVSSAAPDTVIQELPVPAGQSPSAAAIRETERQFAEARGRIVSYRQVIRAVDGLSTEGAELIAYFDGPVLRLADVTIFGERGNADLRLFYDPAGMVRLIERTDRGYDRPHGSAPDERTWRFYVDAGEVAAATVSDRIVDLRDGDVALRASDALALSRRITDAAR
jgi:hypothetical protein